jgi:hypothetical protein
MSYEFDPGYATPSITVEFFDDDGLKLENLAAADVTAIPYRKDGSGFASTITLVDLSGINGPNEPWQEGGFANLGSGQYRLDLPASMCAVTAPTSYVVFHDDGGYHMSREEVKITRFAEIASKIGSGGQASVTLATGEFEDSLPEVVNEGSQSFLTINFKDQAGEPSTPDSATYRVDEATLAGSVTAEIRDDTAISPIASTVVITLTAADNVIKTASRPYEERVVTVIATYGAATEQTEHRYRVKNLRFV